MILGGLEIILGKVILGKIFAGAATKVIVGTAAKAWLVHDAVQVAGHIADVANAADTAADVSGGGVGDLGGEGGGWRKKPTYD